MIHVNRDLWSAKGVVIAPPSSEPTGADGFGLFRVQVYTGGDGGQLTPELARSLRDWLSFQLGETEACAGPDEVRLAVDEQRKALRDRSAGLVSEDYRAGLAWGDAALRKVAGAAAEKAVEPS